ncbi:MAG TPA: glutamine amidotransferase, partial [Gemmatimonadaceae bacterium]|nr:glutamine amidotransferase [Gemmatimonadaceae bacterium]
ALIEFLFKYRPVVFEKGHVVFGTTWPIRLVVLIVGAAALAAITTYARVRVRGKPTDRLVLGGLRALALMLLVFALFRPMLLIATSVTQRNVVGVLVDDSRSMQIRDMNGRTRADVVQSLLGGPDSTLYKSLAKKFIVRFFSLGGSGSSLPSLANLPSNAPRTQIAPALDGVRQDLAGAPVAGLVLASDGADNSPNALSPTLLALNARHIPVFTVGVGQERFAKDLEISRIDAPRTVLQGAAIVLNVDITQRGFGGSKVPLVVEDNGHIVATDTVVLPQNDEATTVRVRVPATEAGARLLTVTLTPQPGEMVKENNTQVALVTVQDRKEKILYVEGEPRFESKFLRLALDDDQNLQLVTILRTAKDKFLRLGIDSGAELASGFPQTREELFGYRGIVLGSIEASYFTFEQLQMISDFVSERGGGLLMLGGRKSFAEGGYAGTPIADVLPVELPAGRGIKPAFHKVKVDLTPIGSISAPTQIAASESQSATLWKTMPVLSSVNAITRAKPGATTLLDGAAPNGGEHTIVLAHQHYGRGEAIAFPVQDSWLWQMRANTPVEDVTYQTFWRQTLRWLVNDVPDRVTVNTSADRAWINEPLQVKTTVVNRTYLPADGADVSATIETPSGSILKQRLESSTTSDGGAYQLAYTPTERGVYRIQVTARTSADTAITSEPAFVDVGTPTTEYIGAEQGASLLKRVAEETGGKYYTPETVNGMAEDIAYTGGGDTTMERLDLWDMPIMLLLLLGLLAGEWGYRRARSLA